MGIWAIEKADHQNAYGAIDQGQGATNYVIFIAEDGQFTLYINDERIGQFVDYTESQRWLLCLRRLARVWKDNLHF